MNSKAKWAISIFLSIAMITGGYFLVLSVLQSQEVKKAQSVQDASGNYKDYFFLRIYYPLRGRILFREIRIPKRTKQIALAESVVEEFFMEPDTIDISYFPRNVKLLGLYKDPDRILYIDLSDEFLRNFQGDALSEYLLLKSLHKSLVSNLQDFRDYKILVEGKEIETLGGHYYLKYTLNDMLSYEYPGEKKL
jgi:spore germination protein GerM